MEKRQTVGLNQYWVAASRVTDKTRDRDKKSGKVKDHEIWSEKISSKGSSPCAKPSLTLDHVERLLGNSDGRTEEDMTCDGRVHFGNWAQRLASVGPGKDGKES